MDPGQRLYCTEKRMEAYRTAMDALAAHAPEVALTDDYDDNLFVLGLLQSNPYAFILADETFINRHTGLRLDYAFSEEKCAEILAFIDREYLTLLSETVTAEMTELEKVLAIHKYFAERIEYDYEWLAESEAAEDKWLFPDIAVYDALRTNKGVCHSYTYLCQFAFQQLGIDCVRAVADMRDGDSSHMWPLVWIGGKTYHIDPTWDRTDAGASLRYFGLTDAENLERGLADNWTIGIDMGLDVACTDTRFSAWRDIVSYELIGGHRMRAVYADGTERTIDLEEYE